MPDDIDRLPSPSPVRRLLGDLSHQDLIKRVIRVNQAGEYGAVRIYEGQMVVLQQSACASTLHAMTKNEKTHLATFNSLLVRHRVRPTALQPIWHVLGYFLGVSTALLGEKAAMACTVAVEEVIEAHYAQQLNTLHTTDHELQAVLTQYRQDELEHREVALTYGAAQHVAFPMLSTIVKAGSRIAIWLSERL